MIFNLQMLGFVMFWVLGAGIAIYGTVLSVRAGGMSIRMGTVCPPIRRCVCWTTSSNRKPMRRTAVRLTRSDAKRCSTAFLHH